MASENVKIIVQEVDETRPRGAGESSDIVYVPGLGTELVSGEYRNVPVLCSSVSEFEKYFGSQPYKFTAADATNGAKVNGVDIKEGEFDRAYIYAKELLNAGLSVLYEDISQDADALFNIGSFDSTNLNRVPNTRNMFISYGNKSDVKVTFNLEGLPAYGCVSIIPKVITGSGVTVTCTQISPSVATPFTKVEVVDGIAQIIWENATSTQLESTLFTVTLNVVGAGQFSMNMVEGDVSTIATINDKTPLAYFYSELPNRFKALEDKNEYNVKYITSGGYPTFVGNYSLAQDMLDVAAARNDAIALIDHPDDPAAELGLDRGVYKAANDYFALGAARNSEFGAMFTPWGDYNCVTMAQTTGYIQAMPASFGYLMCLAHALKTSPNWLAMAGVSRGIVPNLRKLRTNKVLSNVLAEEYQPKKGLNENNRISINAITNVKPYGLTIWGNRTLKPVVKSTVATNFLNIRNMMSDIKKLTYNTAKSLMFEQDSDTLWLSFKSGVSPLLDQLKSGFGISDYKLIRGTTKYDGSELMRGEMSAVIKIFPLYAIEYFEITVVVSDNDVAIS